MPTGNPKPKAFAICEQLEHEIAELKNCFDLEAMREMQAANSRSF
jgi:hypothetical protein